MVGGHVLDHDCVGTNGSSVAYGDGPQDLGTGPHQDVVPQRGVTFCLFHGGTTQRDLLVQHHVVANFSRGPHHNPVGVVNEEPAADLCRRVDLNPGQGAHNLGQDPRGHFPAWHLVEFV